MKSFTTLLIIAVTVMVVIIGGFSVYYLSNDTTISSDSDNTEESIAPSQPGVITACSDGEDNDNDGYIDLEDFGCSSSGDDSEENNGSTECSDGDDNDNDGLIDQADIGCSTRDDDDEGSVCSDGLDNDGDGFSDEEDPGCWTNTADPSSYDASLNDEGADSGYQCSDGLDNDGDGKIDGDDKECEEAYSVLGRRTAEGYITVYDFEHLELMRVLPSSTFRLMNDINSSKSPGVYFQPIARFSGILDGQGHKIFGVQIGDRSILNNLGFIQVLSNGSIVRNISFEDFSLYTNNKTTVGGIFGLIQEGAVVRDVKASLIEVHAPSSSYVGGIAGINKGLISSMQVLVNEKIDPHARWEVYSFALQGFSGGENVGGLVGRNDGRIMNSEIIIDESYSGKFVYGISRVGGIAGFNTGMISGVSIKASEGCSYNCVVRGNEYVGGLVGMQKTIVSATERATLRNSNSSISVGMIVNYNGTRMIGGAVGYCGNDASEEIKPLVLEVLVGENSEESSKVLINGYLTPVEADIVGGFVGFAKDCEIRKSGAEIKSFDFGVSNKRIGGFAGQVVGSTKLIDDYAIVEKFYPKMPRSPYTHKINSDAEVGGFVGNVNLGAGNVGVISRSYGASFFDSSEGSDYSNGARVSSFVGTLVSGNVGTTNFYQIQDGIPSSSGNAIAVSEGDLKSAEPNVMTSANWNTETWIFSDTDYPKIRF